MVQMKRDMSPSFQSHTQCYSWTCNKLCISIYQGDKRTKVTYFTKSVLWTLGSVYSFLGRAIYLCPTDDLISKVFPVNTEHKQTIERG